MVMLRLLGVNADTALLTALTILDLASSFAYIDAYKFLISAAVFLLLWIQSPWFLLNPKSVPFARKT